MLSDWPLVTLVLGLCAVAVALYAVRAWRSTHSASADVANLKTAVAADAVTMATLGKRLSTIETALHIDGQRIVAEAARKNLPAMMR